MKKLFQLLLILLPMSLSAQIYTGKDIKVSLFSSAPLEDIRALSTKATAVFNSQKRELAVQIPIASFEFDKRLMQTHFNENYMESDRYPYTRFKGIIEPAVDFNKNGVYPVNLEGVLSVHGVDKKRSIPAQLTVKDGNIQIDAVFIVSCADHNIKIPSLMFKKIAESVRITAGGQLHPLK